ncbi:MAG: DUF1700 domain-containing protein, partial [Oscillospiraceae bacterium]|nr:DUF1700 domain-containing protein [Oscillospiraceae bacterium]
MNKKDFLDELCRRLRTFPPQEAEKTVSFYSEAIDDRVEDGMTEEEAVRELGSLDDADRREAAVVVLCRPVANRCELELTVHVSITRVDFAIGRNEDRSHAMIPAIAVARHPEIALLGRNFHDINPGRGNEADLLCGTRGKQLLGAVALRIVGQHAQIEVGGSHRCGIGPYVELVEGCVEVLREQLGLAAIDGGIEHRVVVSARYAGEVAFFVGHFSQGIGESLRKVSVLRS